MRISGLLIAVNLIDLASGRCGRASAATGWGVQPPVLQRRRVFNGGGHPHRTSSTSVAFLGHRRAERTRIDAVAPTEEGSVAAGEEDQENVTDDATTSAGTLEPRKQVEGIVQTFRDFWRNAVDGTTALWTNFQTSQDIRKRVKAGHVLTYAEHAHLERGAIDRRKLLQYAIAYAVSPKNFVYVVWYVPGLLPSTFDKPHSVRAKYQRLALERATATLEGLAGLEDRLLKAEASFKGKPRKAGTRQTKKMERLEKQREKVVLILEASSKREVFEQFQEHMVVPAPAPPATEDAVTSDEKARKNKRKPQQLKLPPAVRGVPGLAIKALGKGTGLSGWWHVAPNFYVRYCLNERLRDLGRMDAVLRTVSLDSLNEKDLREACNARAIDVGERLGGDTDAEELRKSLGEWLELTSAEVAAGEKLSPDTIFMADRARLLGLVLNCLDSARKGRAAELSKKAVVSRW